MFAHVISVIKLLVPSSEFTFEKKYFQAGMDQRAGHIKIMNYNFLKCIGL